MNIVDYSNSFLAVLPPLTALLLAVLTRRVLFSLGMGILVGALLLNSFSPLGSLGYLQHKITALAWDDGALNLWNIYILLFLFLLGGMTAMLTLSGGSRAFALWARQRVKTPRGAKLLTVFLGAFIFIDDYFNSLAVGSIARPVTDRANISRAKLAYILDSTAAPVCVMMPASSWGAYIITIIGGILATHSVTEYTPLGAFVAMIPMNLYAIFALLMVLAVSWFSINIGPMRRHERMAQEGISLTGRPMDEQDNGHSGFSVRELESGRVADLLIPIIALVVVTVSAMVFTGYQVLAAEGSAFSIIGAFENTDVGISLVSGGIVGLVLSIVSTLRQRVAMGEMVQALLSGMRSMLPAVYILVFAWTIGAVIKDMSTGKYLSSLVQGNMPISMLPVLLFMVAGIMAFSTGTSWGTFGIMLPIAADMAAAADMAMLLPSMAAVMAGAVFGDHCSPISDTTILSSTGAHCNHLDHVTTQLPYTLIVAGISAVGFVALGITQSSMTALAVSALLFSFVIGLFYFLQPRPVAIKAVS
ncbi:MAG: Na+/H+ antiporter NhaC family protein [Plesiomonas sp.]|uniref:Na+/H+ antiporter NhaC family protein n=1 Tax=Plesiomonas sp. TaxID=2486279 RepID=UPI003F391D05